MSETTITRQIMLAIGKHRPKTRIFRNNTGMGWQGESVTKGDVLIIKNPRPLQAGLCEGSSDLIGWTTTEITPDMVGKRVAIFTAIEVKTATGRPSTAQQNFIEQVRKAGGIAGIARTESEATEIL